MKTIVAVTFQNKKTVSSHAGKCRTYLIYTIHNSMVESKKLLELTIKETLHSFFHNENSTKRHILFESDILLTKGIGNGAIEKLAKNGVACYKIEESDPDIAIEKLINGTLEAMAPISNAVSGCSCNCGNKDG